MATLAFVGCAHIHTPNFVERTLKRPDMTVKYVWDHDSARAADRAGQLGATVADLALIARDEDVSAVIVCSETRLHEELVPPLAAAGKALFVEKPLGMRGDDAERMARAIEAAGVPFQTGYFQRGTPLVRFLREQVGRGNFGTVTRMRASVCHSGALGGWFDGEWRWMADLDEAGVGAFGDLGTHGLDILMWLGGEVERVVAILEMGTARYPDCEEIGEALIRFQSGAIGTLTASWDDASNPISFEIAGTEGHAVVMNGDVYFQSAKVPGADGQAPWTDLPPAFPAGLDAFFDRVAGRPAELVTVGEAAARSVVMEAMYRASALRRWVDVSS